VSVPRREEVARPCESVGQQPAVVSAETASSSIVVQKTERLRSDVQISTGVRSGVRNPLSERCVNSVPSAVALRKRELRTSQLRICEWRTSVPRSRFAYPPASPKDTLAGVFERMKRAARAKKFAYIAERLAPRI
jgi:hypothetical protein